MRISTIRHPEYAVDFLDYLKWRLTYMGGRHFITQYLQKYSKREDDTAFKERKAISYSPSYAKVAINKLKNTMFSRMVEIKRHNGPKSYIDACRGIGGGVDLHGSSMQTFIGSQVLPELMTMKTVGVYVDMPPANGILLSNNLNKRPYLYIYKAEDILTWDFEYLDGEFRYRNILLRDTYLSYDDKTGMVVGTSERYRQMFIGSDNKVHIQFWLPAEEEEEDIKTGEEIVLDLDRIPFVRMALKSSLLADVADYQIALMNIASADVNYVYKANFPTYTEQTDPVAMSVYTRGVLPPPTNQLDKGKDSSQGTAQTASIASGSTETRIGALEGRTYPKGMERPGYIAPPSEPLHASIAKQEQMKSEIFELVDIAASQAEPQHASAESKKMDDRGLESGLSAIGLELEYGEREIAKIWAQYEKAEAAYVNYPAKYTLKSDRERVEEAKALDQVKASAPSNTFTKEIGKVIAHTMLAEKVEPATLDKINAEIDSAEYVTSDPNTLKIALEGGCVDAVTASNAFGFDGKKVVPLAQAEHAERLKRINESQSNPAARGNPDADPEGGAAAKKEKQKTPDLMENPSDDKTRD